MDASVSIRLNTKFTLNCLRRHHRLGWSLLAQSAVFNSMFFMDSFFMGFVGERDVAAVSAASQVTWLYESLLVSVATASGIAVGRMVAGGRELHIRNTVRFAALTTLGSGLVLTAAGMVSAEVVASLMLSDIETRSLFVEYLRIAYLASMLNSVSMSYETALLNLKQAAPVLQVYVLELIVKLTLNVLVILWLQGGVVGLAMTLLFVKIIRLCLLVSRFRMTDLGPRVTPSANPFRGVVLRQAYPIAGSMLLWNASTLILASSFGQLSVSAYATYAVLTNAAYLLLIPSEALTRTSAILAARSLGRESTTALDRGRCVWAVVITALLLSLCLVFAGAAYVHVLPYIQPKLGTETLAFIASVAPLYFGYIAAKTVTDAITEGLLRPTLQNRFIACLELALLPVTLLIFKAVGISLVSGFLYVLLLEIVRMVSALAKTFYWMRSVGGDVPTRT